MMRIYLFALATFLSSYASAFSQERGPITLLTSELKSKTPAKWEVHVRWREEDTLLATITPWPYQDAFELWYDQSKLFGTLTALCPGPDDEIWSLLQAKQDVVLEPTVGGKAGVEARVSCRKLLSATR